MLKPYAINRWNEHVPESLQQQAIDDLEFGNVLFLPHLFFLLEEHETKFLTPDIVAPKAKNISYLATKNQLWGVQHLNDQEHQALKNMLDRFSECAFQLIQELLPRYAQQIIIGRTSFRPVEISDRKTSPRKDDKRLHVDAFPSAPNQGQRILRIFCNINLNDEPRVWRLGESFEQVAKRFIPTVTKPIPGLATTLRLLKITKSYRTLYDHYMLQIHDNMKADENYQNAVNQEDVRFPSGSSWIVFTDHVSHAAMSGQHVLEQTFYLPVNAMKKESLSPLRILEKLSKIILI